MCLTRYQGACQHTQGAYPERGDSCEWREEMRASLSKWIRVLRGRRLYIVSTGGGPIPSGELTVAGNVLDEDLHGGLGLC